ncbi:MAG: aminoglycoside phosphotransferase family protein [Myxococcota bacterium]
MQTPPDPIPAEVHVTPTVVRALLQAQHPDLADVPITPLAEGWDNAIFRLGETWLARIPRRSTGADLLVHELRWLPHLAPHLPIPTPVAHRRGVPTADYPYPWSIVPWFPGTPAGAASTFDPAASAEALGSFLRTLHNLPLPDDPPHNPFRACPLTERDPHFRERLAHLIDLDQAAVVRRWETLLAAPPPQTRCWCHGDLHPFNLVLDPRGQIAAVLDWGDLTAGDPAVDLMVAWLQLPLDAHARFRAELPHLDDAMWARGQAWGLRMALMFIDAGRNMGGSTHGQHFERIGLTTLRRCLSSEKA